MAEERYDAIRTYSGLFHFERISSIQLDQIANQIHRSGLQWDLGATFLELEYSGRDTNRFVLKLLRDIASIIHDARGEVVCEVSDDEHTVFEYYRIRAGRLIRQLGEIVRGPEEILE